MTALLLLRRYWWAGAIVGLLIWLQVERATIARKDAKIAGYGATMARAKAALDLSAERIRTARAEAAEADLRHARAVEQAQNQASQETARDLETQLDAARALAAAYARRLHAGAPQAAAGGGGLAGVPAAADAAGRADDAGEAPELDDATACAEAVTKAQGWLDWWNKQTLIRR